MTEYTQHFFTSGDGLSLGYRLYEGNPSRTPLVCLPGLTRNARDFHRLACFLSSGGEGRGVICVDYRGRGRSDRAANAESYNVGVETQDLLLLIDNLGLEQALFLGTSRGGLILHVLAATAPHRIAGVIFNDIGPELGLEGLRQIQAYLRDAPVLKTWDQAVEHLKNIHGESFPALSEDDWQELARDIYRDDGSRIAADCDPAIGQAFAAARLEEPLPALWPQFDCFPDVPVLVIRGEHSRLLTQRIVEEMQKRRPHIRAVTALGQGHAPLLHVDGIEHVIQDFLEPL